MTARRKARRRLIKEFKVLFSSRVVARREVTQYILAFYNPTRLHSYLGYRSPMEYEDAA